MKKILLTLALAMPCALLTAQTPGGGISDDMLKQIRAEQPDGASEKALRNAMAGTSINQLATVADNPAVKDTYFSHKVSSKDLYESPIQKRPAISFSAS